MAGPTLEPSPPAQAGRDQRIDLLRGFAVVAMVVDHIAGPSLLYLVSGGNRFFTSAAEAFIFVSGLVMGLVYRRLVDRDGLGSSLGRAVERALSLYVLTTTLTLFFIPLSEGLGLPWAQGIDFSDPAAFVVSVLTLHRTYYLVDIPFLYTVLLTATPVALLLLVQGRTGVVLGISWLLWAAYQMFPEQADLPWSIAGNHLFFLSAWQVFFFTGLVIGWHRSAMTGRLTALQRRTALVLSGIGVVALIGIYWASNRLSTFFPDDTPSAGSVRDLELFLIEALFGKADVRPGRIIASVIVFAFLYLLVTEAWRPLRRFTGWFLLPLGQSALYVYTAHVLLAVPIAIGLGSLTLSEDVTPYVNTAIQVGALIALWLVVKWRPFAAGPGARFVWPVAAGATCLLLLPLYPAALQPEVAAKPEHADQYGARVARAFGTPVPGRAPRQEVARPVPPVRPSLRQLQLPALTVDARVQRYVGPIQATLINSRFFSAALERDMDYFVYLPPGYDRETSRYPVLYMLHGNSGSYEEWLAYGLIATVDRLIVAGEIRPMIVVLPQGDYGYWVNHPGDGPRYGDYLVRDLVSHIDRTYPTERGARFRALGGLSMGATGALLDAFRNPGVFGVVGAHSPSLPEDDGTRPFLGEGFSFAYNDPIFLAERLPWLERLKIWIDVGDEDLWVERVTQLHEALARRGIGHEWNELPGEHGEEYWVEHIARYLRFYDAALNPTSNS